MKVLVTGGTGAIGKFLIPLLLQNKLPHSSRDTSSACIIQATRMDIPEKPPDRYARARRLLHAAAFFLVIGGYWWLPWPWWGIMIGVCETVAFALLPRNVEDEPADSMDTGLRIGCGGIAGFVAGIWWTWYHGFQNNTGAIYIAAGLVGAVVFAALAFRFGDKFWNWHNPF